MLHILIADIRGNEVGRIPYDPEVDAIVTGLNRQLSSMTWSGNIMPLHFVIADKRGHAVRMVPPLKYQGLDSPIHAGECNPTFKLRTGGCCGYNAT